MKTGRMRAGRYEIKELLGSGSMGAVYAASDVDGAPLAVKFLHPSLAALPDMRERFEREAVNARRIHSPYVARVVGAGPSSDSLWIAYQRLFGETLEDCLRRQRCLDASFASGIFDHVLHGLEAAHEVGVLHRDIKPANLFLERAHRKNGESVVRACILDFGISKCRLPEASTSSQGLTGPADLLGSVRYIAPEQIESAANVDARADLYSVGVVLYRMLTGALPFASKSAATTLIAKISSTALPLSEVTGVAWPAQMEAFFRLALARHPDARFPSALEMRRAWKQVTSRAKVPDPGTFDAETMREHDPEDFQHELESDFGSTARA